MNGIHYCASDCHHKLYHSVRGQMTRHSLGPFGRAAVACFEFLLLYLPGPRGACVVRTRARASVSVWYATFTIQ